MISIHSDSPEDKYVEWFLNSVIESQDVSIGISDESNVSIIFLRTVNPYSYDLYFPYFKEYEGTKVFCYDEPQITIKDNQIRTNIDLMFSIFFFLSGYYEHVNPHIRDGHGRFPGIASFQKLHGIIEIPVVNQYVNLLVDTLRKIGICAEIREHYRKSYFSLTHDIDSLSASLYTRTQEFQKNRKFSSLIKNHYNVNYLIDIEKNLGIKGTYYFMLSKDYAAGYDISANSNLISKLANSINSIGSNTGIHYSYWTLEKGIDRELLRKLSTILGKTPRNGRHHFLRFDIDRSYRIFDDTGITVDTSGGYADMIGFRFGTSWPFRPYDFANKCAYKVWEIPLIVMDGTLTSANYMNLKSEEGFAKIIKITSFISRYGGIFSLLWHNSSFGYGQWNNWKWIYHEILSIAKQSEYIFINDIDVLKIFGDLDGE